MAGDWIKMRKTLDTHPNVMKMTADLGESRETNVVGMLWKLWSWADSHSLDGNAISVTAVTLDRIVGVTGFASALRAVGWLEGEDGAITFPRFEEHNGETAKKREQTAKRVAKHRNARSVTSVTQPALPEKRREEKRVIPEPPTPLLPAAPEPTRLRPLVEIPAALQADPFPAAWSEWISYRRERRLSSRDRTLRAQLDSLVPLGPVAAADCVRLSIRQGWQGLFPERMTEKVAAPTNGQRKVRWERPDGTVREF